MDSKSIFTSKTFWANLLTAIVACAGEFSGVIPPTWAPYIAAGVGVANIVLRLITTGPVHVVAPPVVGSDAGKQGGFSRLPVILFLAAFSIGFMAVQGCATVPNTPTVSQAAYDAQLTADAAVRQIPILLGDHVISVDTARKIRGAAVAVYQAASAVQSCTTNCSTVALNDALVALAAVVPK